MGKETTRATIIREGARLIHKKGFNATGLSDIITAAGVPKGSFYFYFKSKEEFGLAVIDHYAEAITAMIQASVEDAGRPPLHRLSAFMDGFASLFEKMGHTRGCPIGNLMQEMSDLNEAFRNKVGKVYARMAEAITRCLAEAKDSGDITEELDPAQTAQFILDSWEGAIMHMKLVKDNAPLTLCKRMVFDHILKRQS
ncbi:MAG TPA: TetR family transcriptional regulator C-terminal domain-containing protein [Deltaproteobacteria bacterium]|nr:TetR family transcriptional regulator C-terminal domain-containing protein [Deltaproteobacteria bacterium]